MPLIDKRDIFQDDVLLDRFGEGAHGTAASRLAADVSGDGISDLAISPGMIARWSAAMVPAPEELWRAAGASLDAYEGPADRERVEAPTSNDPLSALGDDFWQGLGAAEEGADAAESIATTYSVLVGQSFYGTISSSTDEDWVAVQLVAGQTYDIRLLGFGSGFLSDPFLRIRDAAGVQLATNDDGFTSNSSTHEADSRLIFTATTTGVHYLEADAFSSQTGDYLLTATNHNAAGMVLTADEIAWQLLNNGMDFFGAPEAAAFNVGIDGSLTVNITALTVAGQTLAREALEAWSNVTGITFVETGGAAEITFDDNQSGAFAQPVTSGGAIISATVNVGTDWLTSFGTSIQSYSFETYVHEVGHALGLAHGGNYNGSANYGTDNFYLNDSLAWSIMSYMQADNDEFDFGGPLDWNTFTDAAFRYMVSPQIADIIAIQHLYGAYSGAFTGNTTWGFNSNTGNTALDGIVTAGALAAFTIYDNGGVDTMDFSGTSEAQIISLLGESMSSVLGGRHNVSVARGVVIENAIGGSGADIVYGNGIANTISGLGGADTLNGGAGDDILIGGLGADALNGGDGSDTASYAGAAARVTIRLFANTAAGGEAVGDVLTGIENLIGTAFNDTLSGDAGDNVIEGGAGPDTLGGREGFDTLSYASSNAAVVINLANQTASGGHATGDVFTAFEGVRGSAFGDTLNGGNGDQTIEGGLGNDRLNGGAGFDTLSFRNAGSGITVNLATTTAQTTGVGSDTISNFERVIGSAFADVITGDGLDNVLIGGAGADALAGGGGFDTADYSGSSAGVSVNLAAGTGSGGDAAGDTLTSIEALIGSGLNDSLTGNGVNNVLTGGAGADALNGAGGTDTASYAASSAAVQVNLGAGTATGGDAQGDTFVSIENLTGSAHDDVLIGNGASNVLIGGAGADVLDGEGGNDWVSYATSGKVTVNLTTGTGSRGDATGDVISDVENVIGSAFSDSIYGSDGGNHLIGGAGNDTLQGRNGDDILDGGTGNDKLNGGNGADLFVFSGASGADIIQDFDIAVGDVIQLDSSLFTDFADAMSATSDVAGNAVISRGGVSITLTGVTKAQLSAGDFAFAAPAPVLPEAKDEALTLPPALDDLDPLVLPADFGPSTKDFDDALILPPVFDALDPLILPAGLEGKQAPDDLPVICPPGETGGAGQVSDVDAAEMALAAFSDGRGLHRFLLEPRGLDWIV